MSARDGGLGFAGLFSSKSSDKTAKKTAKKIQAEIKAAAATQAAATQKAAAIGLKAQKVHEEGELARQTRDKVIRWAALIGGGLILTFGLGHLFLTWRRARTRKNVHVIER